MSGSKRGGLLATTAAIVASQMGAVAQAGQEHFDPGLRVLDGYGRLGGRSFYFAADVWYAPAGPGFVVAHSPRGFRGAALRKVDR